MFNSFKKMLLNQKVVAIILSITFLTQSTLLSYGNVTSDSDMFSDPTMWVPHVLAIHAELDQMKDFTGSLPQAFHDIPTEMQEPVFFEDVAVISGMLADEFLALPDELQREIVELDILAAMLFDFYSTYGFFPEEDEFMSALADSPQGRAMTITAAQSVTTFSNMGFTVTSFAVSQMAAWIATTIGLVAALPVVQIVAIAAGSTIIVGGGILLATTVANRERGLISSQMGGMLGTAWSRTIGENAIRQTAELAEAKRNGSNHFMATRFGGAGGGIAIGAPLVSEASAIAWLLTRGDTFSRTQQLAFNMTLAAARTVAPDAVPQMDLAHNTVNQPLNRAHYHVQLRNGSRTGGHAFF